jgi:hypothetical protein
MVMAGRTLGSFQRKINTSPEYLSIQKASKELRYLPNRLKRDASLKYLTKYLSKDLTEINRISSQISREVKKGEHDLTSWTMPSDLQGNKLADLKPELSSFTMSATPEDPSQTKDNS